MKSIGQEIEELKKQLQELKNEIKTQNQPKFKNGDFVFGEHDGYNQKFIFIFNKSKNEKSSFDKCVLFLNSMNLMENGYIEHETLRLATESEKQQLIDKLRENGKDWDAEKCEIVDYRWRAEKGEIYFRIGNVFTSHFIEDFEEELSADDDALYYSGNYFKTKELAEQAAEKVKELLLTLKNS